MDTKLKENLIEAYNKHAEDRNKSVIQQWKVDERNHFLNLLKKGQKQSLLEIGAGTGRDSCFFIEQGFDVVTTDISPEMVRICKEKGLNAQFLDFNNIESIGKSFDAVWALNCLLHVEKKYLPVVLQGISNILNPSGLFYMGVYGGHNSEGVWENDIYTPHRFFSFYTDEAIKELVSRYFDLIYFKQVDTGEKVHFQSMILKKKDM